ncbi:hypothetical protein AQF52_0110 [Streptomyces venezuelae]|nr:hypothetical protein AQF52_0110 [Streptomyces venezuelae]
MAPGSRLQPADGSIGKISKHSEDVGASYLVVDTGVWIFGKHVLLPAGTIRLIDTAAETVYVDRPGVAVSGRLRRPHRGLRHG